MTQQQRDDGGKFGSKGDEPRQVRSIRLTDRSWTVLGQVAESRGLTRADLLELMAEDNYLLGYLEPNTDHTSGGIQEQLERVAADLVKDPALTRNGKDSGAVKRAVAAMLQRLIAAL